MSRAPNRRLSSGVLWLALAGLVACGDGASKQDSAVVADGGICGTSADPGILNLAGISPAPGTTVANQAIVHGFTVVGAPAEFTSFDFKYSPSHTAGWPTPANPRFTTTVVDSDVVYLLTIDSWSNSPGHVEFSANGGYTTSKNCAWKFPSPLFSYDIIGGPDGGASSEAGASTDGPPKAIDAAIELDAPESYDLPGTEGATAPDAGMSTASDSSLDGVMTGYDAAIDGPASTVDASIE